MLESASQGGSAPGGSGLRGCPLPGGGLLPGGCLLPGGLVWRGVCYQGGSGLGGMVGLVRGVSAPGGGAGLGGYIPACTEADPPVDKPKCDNITLAQLRCDR